MVSTLAFIAVAATKPATFDATDFSHNFKKGTTTTYEMKLTGDDGGVDIEISATFDMTVTEVNKEGASLSVKIKDSSAMFGGQEAPMEMLEDVSFNVNKNGAPVEVDMSGFTAVFYISMLTAYLPNKKLDEGDSFSAKLKMGEMSYSAKGEYVGHGKLDGKEYSVLETKGTLDMNGEDPGELMTKLFFDKSKSRVAATTSMISTPDGDFELKLKVKA